MRSLGVPPVATGGAGAIVVGLLVLLLVEREVIRAWTGGRATGRVLSTAIVPLLVVVALILASRASTVLP
jgi:hypothetical protein